MPDPTRQSVSATEASVLLGASPYSTRWMLYRRFAHGEEVANKEHNRMDWGKRMQPLLLVAAAEDLRFEVIPNTDVDGVAEVYVRNGNLGCTRDATIICPDRGPGALETKACFDYQVWMKDWGGGKRPPRHAEIQLQVQMLVGDGDESFKWGVIGAWCGGEMSYFERKPIPALWELLRKEAAQFLDDVKRGNEPAPIGTPVELPLLAEVFPFQEGATADYRESVDGVPIAEIVRLWAWHSGERLGHERAEKESKAKIAAVMKGAELLLLPQGINVKAKQVKRKGYTVKESSYLTYDPYVPDEISTRPEVMDADLAI